MQDKPTQPPSNKSILTHEAKMGLLITLLVLVGVTIYVMIELGMNHY